MIRDILVFIKAFLLSLLFICFSFADNNASSSAPQWWIERGIIASLDNEFSSSAINNNYSIANIGQLMFIATKAKEELDEKSGSAGSGISDMIDEFLSNYARTESNPNRNVDANYEAVNIGQLKYVVQKFYDRLWEIESTNPNSVTFPDGIIFLSGGTDSTNHKYPWTALPATTASNYNAELSKNYEVANVGQIKFLFSWSILEIEEEQPVVDTNGNGIPDSWEERYYGELLDDVTTQIAGNLGITILDAYYLGLDPTKDYSSPTNGAMKEIIYDNNSMIIEIGANELTRDFEGNVINFTTNE